MIVLPRLGIISVLVILSGFWLQVLRGEALLQGYDDFCLVCEDWVRETGVDFSYNINYYFYSNASLLGE
jgi:hypothetical protein